MALTRSKTDSCQGKEQPAVFQKMTALPNIFFSHVISSGFLFQTHVPPRLMSEVRNGPQREAAVTLDFEHQGVLGSDAS